MTTGPDLIGQFLTPATALGTLYLLRNKEYDGGDLSIAELALPGLLDTTVTFNGLFAIANVLVLDREDGTLLRAKSPNGMIGYFVGKITAAAASVAVQVLVVLAAGLLIIGAILGSVLEGARARFLLTMPLMGLVAISGIFYPITALPVWLQGVGRAFPICWVGLGMRSALFSQDAMAIEIGQSWRHVETASLLGDWVAAGLLIAPVVLRRMARHESGSSRAERRDKAMQSAF
ncbi:ABC transporter permease [Rhodococcus sp. 24CO]|uniref:ABC transporter permease n=1 Tax=Rhodococcus sp. 24CO TaxID=3117460 RepID=UPI003D3544D9